MAGEVPFREHRDHDWASADGWYFCEDCHVDIAPPTDRDWTFSMGHLAAAVSWLTDHAQGKPIPPSASLEWAAKYVREYLDRARRPLPTDKRTPDGRLVVSVD